MGVILRVCPPFHKSLSLSTYVLLQWVKIVINVKIMTCPPTFATWGLTGPISLFNLYFSVFIIFNVDIHIIFIFDNCQVTLVFIFNLFSVSTIVKLHPI